MSMQLSMMIDCGGLYAQ